LFDCGDYISGNRLMYAAEEIERTFTVKIDHAASFLQTVAPRLIRPFNIVTHWGDFSVTDSHIELAKNIPNFRKWFGQNIDCREQDAVHSIPIGLEDSPNNLLHSKSNSLISKTDLLHSEGKHHVAPSLLAYANFYVGNFPSEREQAYQVVEGKSWAVSRTHISSDKRHSLCETETYIRYIREIKSCHYVLCPRGAGIDTHRLWETLYLGRVPIVKRCNNTRYYSDLPILFVDDWNEVTEKTLVDQIDHFSDTDKFNMEKLKLSWWSNFLKSNKP